MVRPFLGRECLSGLFYLYTFDLFEIVYHQTKKGTSSLKCYLYFVLSRILDEMTGRYLLINKFFNRPPI